jgi:hypothetical protein
MAVDEAVRYFPHIVEMEFYYKGVVTVLKQWQKCIIQDGDFVEKCIQCTGATDMVFSYSYLYLILKLICS